jgi:hypothetical protein
MTRAVSDETYLLTVGATIRARTHVVEQPANRLYHIDVALFRVPAHVVRLSRRSCLENTPESPCVVLDEQPVPYVLTSTVDWKWLASERLDNHEWNELLGEVVGPIIVGAIGYERRQAVRVVPRAYQMI